MRDVVTLAFELVWLIMLVVAVAVGVMSRRPGGRRLLRRWFRFPTFVWCEVEDRLDAPDDARRIEEVMARLRQRLPRSERSLIPRLIVVRIVEGGNANSGKRVVTIRAATLLQEKTPARAAERLADALSGIDVEPREKPAAR
jgi:hypothetical protein